MDKKFYRPAQWMLVTSLIFSLAGFCTYLIESWKLSPQVSGLSDGFLFFLLAVLRYSSVFVFICSVYLLAVNVIRAIQKPSGVSILGIIFSIFSALYGAGMIVIEALIIAITGGI